VRLGIAPHNGQADQLIRNAHFWILLTFTIAVTYVYYSWILTDFRPDWVWRLQVLEFQARFHGSLFSVVLLYTALVFWWRGILIMGLMTAIINLPLILYYRPDFVSVLINMFYVYMPFIVVGYVRLQLSWRNNERRVSIERERERQEYIARIFDAQEDERKRIARELHDDTIHSLLVIANEVQNLINEAGDDMSTKMKGVAVSIKNEVLGVSDDLRRMTLDLRPGILDNLGFVPAVRWMLERLNQDGRLDARMVIGGQERTFSGGLDLLLFRITQEALNNVRRHSAATEVVVTMEFGKKTFKIVVQDNGVGFLVPDRIGSLVGEGKLGLMGIMDRVKAVNGVFLIESKPGEGTVVSVECRA
jgi:two-component system, NarL family, sensor histidine kinase DegS